MSHQYDQVVEAYDELQKEYEKLECENADLNAKIIQLQAQVLELKCSNASGLVGASKVFSTILPDKPRRLNE